jgi:hypothetical protein
MPIDPIAAKMAASEVMDEEIPIVSGVVSFDNMNQNAYPNNIPVMFSRYRYTVPLLTWLLDIACHWFLNTNMDTDNSYLAVRQKQYDPSEFPCFQLKVTHPQD